MRSSLSVVALAIVFLRVALSASEPANTDARSDGLFGRIRSVSTTQETQQVDWHQKDAKAGILGISCWECEYDVEGNRIKSGQSYDGEFRGDVIRIIHDETGRVTARIEENYKGEIVCRDVLGPYGITEQVTYKDGKPYWRSTWSYDSNGHMTEFYHYDENGVVFESSIASSDASGNNKEEWNYGRNGVFSLHFVQSYDPETDIWTFTNFNENGSAKVAITTKGSKVLSYWQQAGEDNVFGSNFYRDPNNKTQVSHSCNPDGTCDEITSYFSDEARHQASRVEWHDPAGVLRLSFDYEYEVDQFGNWTKRTVFVWSPELGERKSYETDYRTLKYWGK
jgi:hypothetical protein